MALAIFGITNSGLNLAATLVLLLLIVLWLALIGHGRPGARSRPAQELADLCQAQGIEATAEPNLEPALRRATELACATFAGVLVSTGSHYLIGPARATQGALS